MLNNSSWTSLASRTGLAIIGSLALVFVSGKFPALSQLLHHEHGNAKVEVNLNSDIILIQKYNFVSLRFIIEPAYLYWNYHIDCAHQNLTMH